MKRWPTWRRATALGSLLVLASSNPLTVKENDENAWQEKPSEHIRIAPLNPQGITFGPKPTWSLSVAFRCKADTYLPERFAAALMSADNQIIAATNVDELRIAASLTKVMTMRIAYRLLDEGKIHLSDKIKFSEKASSTHPNSLMQYKIEEGDEITLRDALYALGVKSANDVGVAVAEYITGVLNGTGNGSVEEFADLMNAEAKTLGMTRTFYTNPHGLFEGKHSKQRTTARDQMTLMLRTYQDYPHHRQYLASARFVPETPKLLAGMKNWAAQHEDISEKDGAFVIKTVKSEDPQDFESIAGTQTKLLHQDIMPGLRIVFAKSGYTTWSGYNLVFVAKRGTQVFAGAHFGMREAELRDLCVANGLRELRIP